MIQVRMTTVKGKRTRSIRADERRVFPRIPGKICLKLFVRDTAGGVPGINNFTGWTLDISRGGLRIESPRELATGSMVGFELVDDVVSPPRITGIGEVKWCRLSRKSDNYELGIAFPLDLLPQA